jgi:N-acetylglucosaminyldiphosphoundecaprenol N-acetyl-beta-D-mannosaminyltransferase
MQRVGLEWSYRLVQEPRRMFRRYLVGNSRFLLLTFAELMRR